MKDISNAPGRYFAKMGHFVQKRLDAIAAENGVTSAQSRTLQFIAGQNRPVYQKDIEEEYDLRPATASQMLQTMEDDGLIHREVDAFDRRKKRIVISEKWIASTERMIDQIAEMEEQIICGIEPEKLDMFFEVMEQMLENMPRAKR